MNEQAKLLLSAYRASGQDTGDPTFDPALEATRSDAALAAWFAEQQTFDREVVRRLTDVPAPAGLRERILAGARVSAPRAWWRWPSVWALAAVLTIVAVLAAIVSPSRGVARWQSDALAVLEDLEVGRTGFNRENADATQLVAWLKSQSAPSPSEIPGPLTGQPTYGCKTWKWEDRDISLVCFRVGERGGVHLFTIARDGLKDAPPEGAPVFRRHGNWHVASWSQGDRSHMLAGEEGEAKLRAWVYHHWSRRDVPALAVIVP